MADTNVMVAEPQTSPESKQKKQTQSKRPPRYSVILWDDSYHTFDYVIIMMRELFGYAREQGERMAYEVDRSGKVVCITTTLEHAELKRDQIQAYGRDPYATDSRGSMCATIEPADQ